MAAVRMLIKLSGMRDGLEWPEAGAVLVCPDAEAESLIGTGLAAAVAKTETVEAASVVCAAETASVTPAKGRKRS